MLNFCRFSVIKLPHFRCITSDLQGLNEKFATKLLVSAYIMLFLSYQKTSGGGGVPIVLSRGNS
jgi:hypothetical protein